MFSVQQRSAVRLRDRLLSQLRWQRGAMNPRQLRADRLPFD
jgi:hypothetical protein